MKRYFETTRDIDAPADEGWKVLVDVGRWPSWTPTVRSVERLESEPMQVGSRAVVRQPKLPRAMWQVTGIADGREFTWESTSPGVRTIARHQVLPDGEVSRVVLSIEHTGPLSGVAALLWGRLTQRYIELEAKSLDAFVTRTPAA
jgi:uncharacterized membrane protein